MCQALNCFLIISINLSAPVAYYTTEMYLCCAHAYSVYNVVYHKVSETELVAEENV